MAPGLIDACEPFDKALGTSHASSARPAALRQLTSYLMREVIREAIREAIIEVLLRGH
jgi:hypothetical protein